LLEKNPVIYRAVMNKNYLNQLGLKIQEDSKFLKPENIKDFCETFEIKKKAEAWVNHTQAYLTENFPFKGNSTFLGLAQDVTALGSYAFLKYAASTGSLVKKQIDNPEMSFYVPLVLQGYKKFLDIKYTEWGTVLPKHIPEKLLSVLLEADEIVQTETALGSEEFLFRRAEIKDTKSWSGIPSKYGTNNHVRSIIWQTWVCHPDVRVPSMLLGLQRPEEHPPAWVTTDLLPKTSAWLK